MGGKNGEKKVDPEIAAILSVLDDYKQQHPRARIEVKRQNPVALRIRIIDPDFEGVGLVQREGELWKLLKELPDEVFVNITMLLLLTSREARSSLASQEFDDPIPSTL